MRNTDEGVWSNMKCNSELISEGPDVSDLETYNSDSVSDIVSLVLLLIVILAIVILFNK